MDKRQFDFVDITNMNLLIDFYELTMCASYFENKRNEVATFDLFIRKMPSNRSYFVFAGLEQVLFFLQSMKFNEEHLDYLREKGLREKFLEYLKNLKFTGEVWSVPEGTIVFNEEPLIRVTAPVIEAQLIETFILNTVNLQTMIATKASRVVNAAAGRTVVEFGLRRTQGTDAGMKAARCSYLAGADGTSNVLAGMKYGIPVFGTMAHSFVMFFDREIDSFRAFAKTFPRTSTFLIDTYDEVLGAENAATVAKELEKKGCRLNAVRLDSGDLYSISCKVRATLDQHGLGYVKIFVSGDLDEYAIDKLVRKGARIDAFGVGTRMSTSDDRPYVDVVYKLAGRVERGDFIAAMKLSEGKLTLPGKKQIYRQRDRQGKCAKDIVGLEDEDIEGDRLLKKFMEHGQIVRETPSLERVRKETLKNLLELPEKFKRLKSAPPYNVDLSHKLRTMRNEMENRLRRWEGRAR